MPRSNTEWRNRKLPPIFDPVYLIRQVKKDEYEIAKFTDGKQPETIYNVWYNGHDGTCNCPASWRDGGGPEHKHVKMVAEWIAAGKPLPVAVQHEELGLNSGDDMNEEQRGGCSTAA
jgi:hypothetical protein